jgi:glycine cleavage system protein P-like pyridoxal-binding family
MLGDGYFNAPALNDVSARLATTPLASCTLSRNPKTMAQMQRWEAIG